MGLYRTDDPRYSVSVARITHMERAVSIYTESGYKNRREYLECMAEDYGVDIDTVLELAGLLGPEEDFDGLVCALEDIEATGGYL